MGCPNSAVPRSQLTDFEAKLDYCRPKAAVLWWVICAGVPVATEKLAWHRPSYSVEKFAYHWRWQRRALGDCPWPNWTGSEPAAGLGSWDRQFGGAIGTLQKFVRFELVESVGDRAYPNYLVKLTTVEATATDPPASWIHCSPADVAAAKNATAQVADSHFSPGDAILHAGSETKPAEIKNVKLITFLHFARFLMSSLRQIM